MNIEHSTVGAFEIMIRHATELGAGISGAPTSGTAVIVEPTEDVGIYK